MAGVGDVVVARHNDRHLRLPDGEWVRNRDRFVVTATHQDGAMTVRAMDRDGKVVLPAGYVAEHVELGYAGTMFSAQGRTVATAHALVGVGMTREALYVAATRAREANRLYVDVEPEPVGAEMAHGQAERLNPREVLLAVASRRGADLSVHQTMASEWARASSFDQLVKEHQSLVAAAMAQRWQNALDSAGLPDSVLAQARRSPEWTGRLSALRDADDRGLDVNSALSVLAKLPLGAIEEPEPPASARMPSPSAALDLAEYAVRNGAAWAKPFGTPPTRQAVAEAWWDCLAVVAAYRVRWNISSRSTLGEASEGHWLTFPSRPPRPGATSRPGSCPPGRGGTVDRGHDAG